MEDIKMPGAGESAAMSVKESMSEFPVTSVRVCVDEKEPMWKGFLCGVTLSDQISFEGADGFIRAVDKAYTQIGQPQPTVVSKSFSAAAKGYDSYVGNPERFHSAAEIHKMHGCVRTYDLIMRSRRHAEWQGMVKDLDGSVLFTFETMMELMAQIVK